MDEALARQTYNNHILKLKEKYPNSNSLQTWDELTPEDQDFWIYYFNTIFKFES